LDTTVQDKVSISTPFLYLVVFTSGMTTLAVELSASRLLGNVFGASNLVWANVIGLMLLYLTVGYFIGGRWADRSPKATTLFQIILWGAFLSALIPLVSRPILSTAAQAVFGAEAALALGSFISILILFSVPITLLGMVSPFVIRLAVSDVATAGKVAGQIYAISTLGSLVGTFLPVLLIIPELGTIRTFLLFAGILYSVTLIGLFRINAKLAIRYIWMPIAITLLAFILLNGPLRPPAPNATLLYEKESAYNYIQVQEDDNGFRYLYLNEGQGIHSQWHPTQVFYGRTWDFFLTAPYFNETPYTPDKVESLLVIGLATGTIPRQYIEVYGDIPIDGIEIDPTIIEAGEQFFDMNSEDMPSLTAYAEDGRYMLNQLNKKYTIIGVDAYRPPYIPWHLTTVEFFREIKNHLTDDGVMVINVGRTDTDRRLVDALTNTLSYVYPSIHAMDVPYSFNTILVATVNPTDSNNLLENMRLKAESVNPVLYEILSIGVASLVPTGESDILFTDDRAPVETLVDSLVLNFLLSGGAEDFRTADDS
jgi:spermidine synthase